MLNFIEFVNESLVYSEGIKQKDVPKTQKFLKENLLQLLRITENDISFIGSAGKKKNLDEYSHNINVAIDLNKLLKENNLDIEDLETFIPLQFKRINVKPVKENNKFIFKYPINGNFKRKDSVEVHLELVENLEWISFSRYSPNLRKNESKYTSKYREALFNAIVKTVNKKIVSYFDMNEKVKEYETYYYSTSEGLGIAIKSFEGKNGVLKKSILLENSKRIITSDPKEFTKILFGEKYEPKDIMTFEQCINIIKSKDYIFSKKSKAIIEKLKSELVGFRLEIPENI